MKLSQRVNSLKPSATLAVANRATAMKREGIDVLQFSVGEPDFDTPKAVKQAAIDAITAGGAHLKYTPVPGDPATRALIAAKLTKENHLPGITADHVVISSGGKHSEYLAYQCLFDVPATGEAPQELILPVPAWVSLGPMAELAGAKVVEIPTSPQSDFKITPQQLRAAITPRSRCLVINSPSNPCGTMYTPDELKALAAVVAEAAKTTAPDLVILSDEIYEKITYGSAPFFSIGSIPEVAERTITVNGLSKSHSMTGWRVGYTAASGPFGLDFAKAMIKLQGQTTTCIPGFILPAIRAALEHCAADVEHMRQAFANRAKLIHPRLAAIPGIICPRPTGAFYVFPDVSAHFGKSSPKGKKIASANDFAAALLEEHHMAVVPGEDFGGCGKNHIRISFACSEMQIEEGTKRLGAFVASLK